MALSGGSSTSETPVVYFFQFSDKSKTLDHIDHSSLYVCFFFHFWQLISEMSESEAGPSRITLSPEDLINIDKEQLVEKWCKQERYLDFIVSQLANAGIKMKLGFNLKIRNSLPTPTIYSIFFVLLHRPISVM